MTNSDGLLPAALENAFASGTVVDARGETLPLAGNVSREEALGLYYVTRRLRPTTSVEIGFAQGISTTAILKALADNGAGTHHVLDPNQKQYGYCGVNLVTRAGVADRMIFHEKYAEEVIPGLPTLQFAFIDSSHLFDLTINEFVLVDKKLAVGGVIGFHDLWMPSLQKVLRYVLANRAYRVYPLSGASAASRGGWRTGVKIAIASALRHLPSRGRRMLDAEALQPWCTLGIGSLAFIEKLDDDRRPWTFHQEF